MDGHFGTFSDIAAKEASAVTFSDMAKLLHRYIGTEKPQGEYVHYLISLFMHEPITDEDKALDAKDEYYPYSKKSEESSAIKVYTGGPRRNLPVKKAKCIVAHLNKTRLIDAIYQMEADPKDQLCSDLLKWGIDCSFESVSEDVVDSLFKIIDARAQGKEGYEFRSAIPPEQPTEPQKQLELGNIIKLGVIDFRDGVMYYPGGAIKLPPVLQVTEQVTNQESPYVTALCEAYADSLERNTMSVEDIPSLSRRYGQHFTDQRKAYYAAEYVRESVRDVFADGECQFDELEDEAYAGISETYWDDYKNGFERLNAVLRQAASTQLNKSSLYRVSHLVGVIEMKGLCHIMVNDKRIRSWVNLDG